MPKNDPKPTDRGGRKRKSGGPQGITCDSPSETHIGWYHLWAVEGKSYSDVGKSEKVSRQAVYKAVNKVADWFLEKLADDIIRMRQRQTTTIEKLVEQAIASWNSERIVEHFETTTDAGKKVEKKIRKIEKPHTNVNYLNAALTGMNDLRRIWGIDKPQKLSINQGDDEELLPIEGITRAEAIKRQGEHYLELAKTMEGKGL
jgi:predicted DNA-binding protein YlxM (UPF0122 family)